MTIWKYVLLVSAAQAFLHRPSYFDGVAHRQLPKLAGSDDAAWANPYHGAAEVTTQRLPYAQIVHPLPGGVVAADADFNVTFVYVARQGVREVCAQLMFDGSAQPAFVPTRYLAVPYDPATGKVRPLTASFGVRLLSSEVSLTVALFESGCI